MSDAVILPILRRAAVVALREIAKPYPADQDRLIHSQQQIASIARAALKGDDHD